MIDINFILGSYHFWGLIIGIVLMIIGFFILKSSWIIGGIIFIIGIILTVTEGYNAYQYVNWAMGLNLCIKNISYLC